MRRRRRRLRSIDAAVRPVARTGRWLAFAGYLVLLHAALLVAVFHSNFLLLAGKTLGLTPPEEWNQSLVARILEQAEADGAVLPGGVVLVGDSIAAQLDARQTADDAVNFGIGGDTTRTLYARLPVLRSIQRSRAVVVEVGVNDLKYRPIEQIARDYDAVLDRLSASPSIVAVSVLPVDANGPAARQRSYLRNERIAALNRELKRVCAAHARCRFLDAWPALANSAVYSDDGWHLSAEGNRVLAQVIRKALPAPE